jgi:hypothetical protein
LRAAGVALPAEGGNPPQQVSLASGDTTDSSGVVTLRVRFKNLADRVPCLVLRNILGGVDLILGNDWLSGHRAVIDYYTNTCVAHTHIL